MGNDAKMVIDRLIAFIIHLSIALLLLRSRELDAEVFGLHEFEGHESQNVQHGDENDLRCDGFPDGLAAHGEALEDVLARHRAVGALSLNLLDAHPRLGVEHSTLCLAAPPRLALELVDRQRREGPLDVRKILHPPGALPHRVCVSVTDE